MMLTETLLAYLHLIAILSMVVFISSQAALCRSEWLTAAVVHRLVRLDIIYWSAAGFLLLSGLARTLWGIKSAAWYVGQPLWYLKLGSFLLLLALSVKPSLAFRRWRRALGPGDACLPGAAEIKAVRGRIMWTAHLMMLIPLAGVLLARGLGVRG